MTRRAVGLVARLIVVLCLIAIPLLAITGADQGRGAGAPPPGGLKIVIIEGEGAINIVQQKTAVRPIVEVRDRNDQPVAGAVVRFAIQGGRASFNGARVLSVTTNAAGRAAVGTLMPSAAGSVQIAATATFQGQIATATIVQTNFLTAAAAEAAGSAAAGGGAAGGGAGGAAGGGTAAGGTATGATGATSAAAGTTAGTVTGATGAAAGSGAAGAAAGGAAAGGAVGGAAAGGISTAAVGGIVGGAAVGGTLVAKKTLGESGTAYTGTWSGQLIITFTNNNPQIPPDPCTVTIAKNGDITLRLTTNGDSVTGTASGHLATSQIATTCIGAGFGPESDSFDGVPVTGSVAAFTFSGHDESTFPNGSNSETYLFTGTLAENVITGTLKNDYQEMRPTRHGSGSVTIPVVLR